MNLVLHINLLIFVYHSWMRVMEDFLHLLLAWIWIQQTFNHTYTLMVYMYANGIIYSDSSEISINHLIINRHFCWWLKRKRAINWWHYDAFDKSLPNIYLFMLVHLRRCDIGNTYATVLWWFCRKLIWILKCFCVDFNINHRIFTVRCTTIFAKKRLCSGTIEKIYLQRWWKCPNI